MPTYEYKCSKCGHIFEIIQKITADSLKFCPECKGPIQRIISAAGIVFKGSGFHVTDYSKKEIKEAKKTPVTEKPKEEGEKKPKQPPTSNIKPPNNTQSSNN